MSETAHLHLFAGFGIEMEYMIVDAKDLRVRPFADRVLRDGAGGIVNEIERNAPLGPMAWSNELVEHVIEVKTNGPAPTLAGLGDRFFAEVQALNAALAKDGARLLPTAMHPLFDPAKETSLWPHDDTAIYRAYDRIFSCKGHGWSNLQSVHINLPFFDDAEFGRLHAAIRLVLPLLPALAASSPVYAGQHHGLMDSRLEFYRQNQRAVPELTGDVIPEPVFTHSQYEDVIYAKIRRAIAPHDPDGILDATWLNSRGAIARFDRNAIEIRLLDIQESPRLDAAVIALVVSVVKALAEERWAPLKTLKAWSSKPLKEQFLKALKDGDQAPVADRAYLKALGFPGSGPIPTAGAVWRHLAHDLAEAEGFYVAGVLPDVEELLRRGCLARRILEALGPQPSEARILTVYRQLAETLVANGCFEGSRRDAA